MLVTENGLENNSSHKKVEGSRNLFDTISKSNPGNSTHIGADVEDTINDYYVDARKQSQQSFYCALGAAIVGVVFFLIAVIFQMNENKNYATLSVIAGSIIQVISAINFFLYGKAAQQFATFHICLERTNRYIIANCICDSMTNSEKKDEVRRELIVEMSKAPMLTLDMVTKGKVLPTEKLAGQ